jgi:hypothetical protein
MTKAQMLQSMAATRTAMEKWPASQWVIQMHDIMTRFENAYADGREPSQEEIKGYFGEMSSVLDRIML